jgi:GGDEF domain-containing protein
MNAYNKSFGWDVGNDTLMEVALRIKALFCSSFVFRVFGDDFVVLNPLHVDMDTKVFYKLTAGFDILKVSISHFDLHQEEMKNWKSLEKYLLKSQ